MRKIHIVDDDPQIRTLLEEFLTEKGYEASASENGRAALDWLVRNDPDLILLDMCMPGISGLRLLRKIAALYPSVPIIVISGQADEESAREVLQAGAYDFFLKPFDLASIESHLRMKLEEREASEQEVRR